MSDFNLNQPETMLVLHSSRIKDTAPLLAKLALLPRVNEQINPDDPRNVMVFIDPWEIYDDEELRRASWQVEGRRNRSSVFPHALYMHALQQSDIVVVEKALMPISDMAACAYEEARLDRFVSTLNLTGEFVKPIDAKDPPVFYEFDGDLNFYDSNKQIVPLGEVPSGAEAMK